MNNAQKPKYNWYKGKHLGMILIIFMFYFLYVILVAGSTNTVFPLISQLRGWDNNKILLTMTIAGYIGAFSIMIQSRIVMSKGAKFVAVGSLIATTVLVATWGLITKLGVFLVMLCVLRFFLVGFQSAAGPALTASWFPRTKGIMLGWATMGVIFSDIIWSPYIPKIVGKFGITPTFLVTAVIYAVFTVIVILFVKNTPEEAGTYPDGCADGALDARAAAKAAKEYKSPWTIKKILSTKQTWFIIFGWGFLWMSASMFLNQIVPRVVSLGYDVHTAINVLQVAAFAALFGSWSLGVLDQKFGTKTASLILGAWEIVMFVCALLMRQSMVFVWLAPIGIMFGVGAICNLIPSIMISIWGRYDFPAVNRVISCAHQLITSSAFALIAIFKGSSLGFDGMYVLCLILCCASVVMIALTKVVKLGKFDN